MSKKHCIIFDVTAIRNLLSPYICLRIDDAPYEDPRSAMNDFIHFWILKALRKTRYLEDRQKLSYLGGFENAYLYRRIPMDVYSKLESMVYAMFNLPLSLNVEIDTEMQNDTFILRCKDL